MASADPLYFLQERSYKLAAHELWCELLNQEVFDLLDEEQYQEICRRAGQIEAKTKIML